MKNFVEDAYRYTPTDLSPATERPGMPLFARPIRRTLSVAAVLTALAFPSIARAGDTSDLQGLLDETVVTTASKTPETGTNAPATSTTLTADDIRRYGIHTVDEAINFLSLGGSTYNPLYTPDIGARGVTIDGDRGDHVLLLVDGHSMNDAAFGGARYGRGLGVPIELIDHIEVILGPGAVLYGSNAMLAVINVVTRRAKDYQGVHVQAETEIALSYRGGVSAATPFTIGDTKGEVVVGAEYFESHGPNFTFGPQETGINPLTRMPWQTRRDGTSLGIWGGEATHTPYAKVPSGYLTARLGDFQLHVQASTFKFAAPYRARLIQDFVDFDEPNAYQIDRVIRGDLTWQRAVSQLMTLKARGYADSYDDRTRLLVTEPVACRFAGNAPTCRYDGMRVAQWGGLELQSSFNWALDGSIVTLLGVDGRWRFVQGKDDAFNDITGAQTANSDGVFKSKEPTLGPYIQNTWQPAPWFGLNAGARLDYDARFDPVISPRAAVTTKPWRDGTFKVVYSEAFRAPSFVESNNYGVVNLPAHDLKPETVRSVEASVEQRAGSHRIMFGAFRSWWSNMIEAHQLTADEKAEEIRKGTISFGISTSGITQYRNVSSIENYGFNSTYEGSAGGGRFRYSANVTGAIARRVVGDVDRALTLAPSLFGNARISYDLQNGWPTLALAGHFTGRRIADRAWDGGFAQYPIAPTQVELRGTILGPVPGITGLSYRFSANYVIGDRGPYVVGFLQGGISGGPGANAELVPVDTFRTTVGLQYDFFR